MKGDDLGERFKIERLGQFSQLLNYLIDFYSVLKQVLSHPSEGTALCPEGPDVSLDPRSKPSTNEPKLCIDSTNRVVARVLGAQLIQRAVEQHPFALVILHTIQVSSPINIQHPAPLAEHQSSVAGAAWSDVEPRRNSMAVQSVIFRFASLILRRTLIPASLRPRSFSDKDNLDNSLLEWSLT
jgi:hypothetical protein